MPSFVAFSTSLSVIPELGKAMTPFGSRLSSPSLRRNGAARPWRFQSGFTRPGGRRCLDGYTDTQRQRIIEAPDAGREERPGHSGVTARIITPSCRLVPERRRVRVQRGVPAMTVAQMSFDLAGKPSARVLLERIREESRDEAEKGNYVAKRRSWGRARVVQISGTDRR